MKPLIHVAFVLVAATGCASTLPPPELVAARSAYDRAAAGPASQFDPADLHSAQETLAAAERSFDKDSSSQNARDIAYIAARRSEIAAARGDAIRALRQRDAVVARSSANQTAQVQITSAALSRANQQLSAQTQALTIERQRAADAEARAAQAAADLARIATVKQEARGMVITLSGSVLFASSKSDILPAARSKLNDVANALMQQDPQSKIVVQGYTDSSGSSSLNQDLSQRRAETVRKYLVSRGVPSERISAQGMGASNPIADNTSVEGRANNRRVEIVVQPSQS